MSQESIQENIPQFNVGDEAVYGTRLWEIKEIKGDEAEIYAAESIMDIPFFDIKAAELGYSPDTTPQQLAASHYGAELLGEPFKKKAIGDGGEIYVTQKMVFKEEARKVKLADLKSRDSITA